MKTFEVSARCIEDCAKMEDIMELRLEMPMAVRVRDPAYGVEGRHDRLKRRVELARNMQQQLRREAAIAIYRMVAGKEAPDGFDWEAFDRDEFAELREEHKKLEARAEQLADAVQRFCDYFETEGKNYRPILRSVGMGEV